MSVERPEGRCLVDAPGINQAIELIHVAKDTGRKVAIAHLIFHHLVAPPL